MDRSYDPRVLAGLVGDDPAALRETLALFLAVGREWRASVAAAAAAGDARVLGELGHRMKSSGRAIGAERLGAACAALETVAAAADLAGARAAAAHALDAFAAVEAEVAAELAIQSSSASTGSGRENR